MNYQMMLDKLAKRNAEIARLVLSGKLSQKEAAAKYKLSKQRVNRIVAAARGTA